MERTVERQKKGKQDIKTCNLPKSSIVKSQTISDKELLHRTFLFFHNKFKTNPGIESYCTQNSLDITYLGIADGSFYRTVTKKGPSFTKLQNLGILNKDGKDSYGNHLVIPTLEGMQVSSLEFIDLSNLDAEEQSDQINLLPLSDNFFRVDINGRLYQIQGLVKSDFQLKATVKLQVGKFRHVDVINFYSSGNRKRLIGDICEQYHFPFEDINTDIQTLMELCENYETEGNPALSVHANEFLKVLSQTDASEFTCADIEELMLWNNMKAHRVIKELRESEHLKKTSRARPYRYKVSEILLQDFIDLQ